MGIIPKKDEYQKIYSNQFKYVSKLLPEGTIKWSSAEYEAFIYKEDDVCLVFYPHRTTARNYNLRVRDRNSKNKDKAIKLMKKLSHWDNEYSFVQKTKIKRTGLMFI